MRMFIGCLLAYADGALTYGAFCYSALTLVFVVLNHRVTLEVEKGRAAGYVVHVCCVLLQITSMTF